MTFEDMAKTRNITSQKIRDLRAGRKKLTEKE